MFQSNNQPNKKLRVGIIFGGRSAEHEVSLKSARSVLAALDPNKYEATLIGITRAGRWLPLTAPLNGPADPAELMLPFSSNPEAVDNTTHAALLPDPSIHGLVEIVEAKPGMAVSLDAPLDVIFPVLHGPYGEDGTLQGLLEMANVPYVGPGVMASAVGMDKAVQKEVFKSAGLPIIDYTLLKRRDWQALATNPTERNAWLENIEAKAGYPCFVKPVNMGSSVGVGKARNRSELVAAIDEAALYDRKVMIERGISPRELEVAVLGNDEPQASVVGELAHSADFYDYKAKYVDAEGLSFFVPAKIAPELSDRIRSLALQAFLGLDCAGMTRVDFFLDKDSGDLYLNEVNTIPGFTSLSMYPMLWEASGLTYPQLVDKLIELALERHADKNQNQVAPK